MENITQDRWRELLENDSNAVILDVRTHEEVVEGIIPGAVIMDIQDTAEFYAKAQKLDASKNYYVYCRSGGRSGQACMLFNALGIRNAYNLIGGMMAWNGEIKK